MIAEHQVERCEHALIRILLDPRPSGALEAREGFRATAPLLA
jgi:hypothetical protein